MSFLDSLRRAEASGVIRRIGLPGLDKPRHTSIVLGNGQIGHQLKVICWGSGTGYSIKFLACSVQGRLVDPYPVCEFCGHVFDVKTHARNQKNAGLLVDTDEIDAWPGLPAPLWASDGS